jgi:Predicted metal-dependent hydrolase of the TIM-barrel fold
VIDAYSHLDLEHPNPIADMEERMHAAGVESALLVETWNGANRGVLEKMLNKGPVDLFRIALCYRKENVQSLRRFLDRGVLTGVRMSTADIASADEICGVIGQAGALLIAHAESGIGALCRAMARMRGGFPQVRIYIPHLGWPANKGEADVDWKPAIRELAAIPSLILGVSAVAHFSRLPFPHEDVREWTMEAVSLLPPSRIAVASDYPLFEKGRYAEYLSLARDWVMSIHPDWSFAF